MTPHPSPGRPPLRRRLVFAVLLVAVAVVVAELLAALVVAAAGGGLGEIREERRRIAAGEALRADRGTATAMDGAEALLAELQPATGAVPREVLHPFLGYVFNPALNEAEDRRGKGMLEIDELGFFRPPGAPPREDPEAVRVGVFGGSVAFVLAFDVREELVAELSAALADVPALAGRPVVVESFALGGYKQPQQLAALAWLLARGERLDLVINLDGFNEVALPLAENLPRGTALDYPRDWSGRVAGIANPGALRRAGKGVLLREERRERARAFSAAPWRWSPTANLLWRFLDRRLAERIAEAALAPPPAATETAVDFQAHGPFDPPPDREALFLRLADLWARGSLQMHRLCTANGIPYVHFLQPNQYVPDSKPLAPRERAEAFDPDHPYRPAVVEGYPHLRRAGEELEAAGVAYHDLTGIFEGVQEPLYVDTCCHLNRSGNHRLAAAMGEAVRRDVARGRLAAAVPSAPRGMPQGRR